jgi:cytochrome c oxidase assembly factor CtaG
VIEPAADERPVAVAVPEWVRPALMWTGLVLLVAVLVPPLSTLAGRYEFVEALRFSILAVAVPALVALGAPWSALHLAASPTSPGGGMAVASRPAPPTYLVDRVAAGRRRHLGFGRSLAVLLVEMALILVARTPAAVDAVARHSWLALVEAAFLLAGGVALWLEIVASPPLAPRLSRPKRIAVAAVVMWTIWVSAYIVGLSHGSVYSGYHHLSGGGLSVAADQEMATFMLWFAAAAAFVPIVFWNLVAWLRADEDPDDGLQRLVRESHRRSWGPAPGAAAPPARPPMGSTG